MIVLVLGNIKPWRYLKKVIGKIELFLKDILKQNIKYVWIVVKEGKKKPQSRADLIVSNSVTLHNNAGAGTEWFQSLFWFKSLDFVREMIENATISF